jgi:ATP adenylyltransferase
MEYILKEKNEACIFCEIPKENQDKENYVLYRGKFCFVILNTYPYNNGHIMIAPYTHIKNLEELNKDTINELMSLCQKSISVLKEKMNPQGFNIGANIGKVAGAGILEHVHLHVVPRWQGDTNFMPVISDTKVMPQYLSETYDLLKTGF